MSTPESTRHLARFSWDGSPSLRSLALGNMRADPRLSQETRRQFVLHSQFHHLNLHFDVHHFLLHLPTPTKASRCICEVNELIVNADIQLPQRLISHNITHSNVLHWVQISLRQNFSLYAHFSQSNGTFLTMMTHPLHIHISEALPGILHDA